MDATIPLSKATIQESFLELVESKGEDGLLIENRDIEYNVCEALGIATKSPRVEEMVMSAVNELDRGGAVRREMVGKPITISGSHGQAHATTEKRIYRKP